MINSLIHLQNWSDWALIYIAIGGLIILGIIYNRVKKMPSTFVKNLMRSIGYKKSIKEILQDWLVYTIAGLLVFAAWPLFLGWLIHDKKERAKDLAWQNKPNFKSAHQYLKRKTTIDIAEAENHIHDPLGYTPQIPFGYLNKAWRLFLENLLDGDELWYFEIPKGSKVGKYDRETNGEITGIALLRDGKITDEFLITSD